MRPNNLRGKLLEFLKNIYPLGSDERSIVSVFYEYHRQPDIITSLEYLADKAYIVRQEVPHPYKPTEWVKMYKISPSGIDLLDGLIKDPGVLVGPSED